MSFYFILTTYLVVRFAGVELIIEYIYRVYLFMFLMLYFLFRSPQLWIRYLVIFELIFWEWNGSHLSYLKRRIFFFFLTKLPKWKELSNITWKNELLVVVVRQFYIHSLYWKFWLRNRTWRKFKKYSLWFFDKQKLPGSVTSKKVNICGFLWKDYVLYFPVDHHSELVKSKHKI